MEGRKGGVKEGRREARGRGGKKEGREEGKWERKKRKERSEGSRTYTLSLLAPQRGLYHIRSLFKIEYNVHRIKFALLCVQFNEFWKNVLTPM